MLSLSVLIWDYQPSHRRGHFSFNPFSNVLLTAIPLLTTNSGTTPHGSPLRNTCRQVDGNLSGHRCLANGDYLQSFVERRAFAQHGVIWSGPAISLYQEVWVDRLVFRLTNHMGEYLHLSTGVMVILKILNSILTHSGYYWSFRKVKRRQKFL